MNKNDTKIWSDFMSFHTENLQSFWEVYHIQLESNPLQFKSKRKIKYRQSQSNLGFEFDWIWVWPIPSHYHQELTSKKKSMNDVFNRVLLKAIESNEN